LFFNNDVNELKPLIKFCRRELYLYAAALAYFIIVLN